MDNVKKKPFPEIPNTQNIKRLLTIEKVVSFYLTLKKRGVEYVCCCPFHKERTPSFFVRPSSGLYKCFGCGESGDIFSFIEKMEKISFLEVIKVLGERYPEVADQCKSFLDSFGKDDDLFEKRRAAIAAIKNLQTFFEKQLWETEEGKKIGLSYLHERGVNADQIKKYKLGFSPDNNIYIKEKENILCDLGYVENSSGKIKLFPNRISFPFFNSTGDEVGFSWRLIFPHENKNVPKYINSSESFIFKKKELLFGFNLAKHKMREKGKCFLVEGFFDVMALSSFGIENCVCSAGTALSVEQCLLLSRFVDCVSICFDSDEAGERATVRAIELLLQAGLIVNVVRLKEGKDPDEFFKIKGIGGLEEFEKSEEDFVSFLFRFFQRDASVDLQKKTFAVRKVSFYINFIKDSLYRSLALKRLGVVAEVDVQSFLSSGEKVETGKRKIFSPNNKKENFSTKCEEDLLVLFFRCLAGGVGDEQKSFFYKTATEVEEMLKKGELENSFWEIFLNFFWEKEKNSLQDLVCSLPEGELKKKMLDALWKNEKKEKEEPLTTKRPEEKKEDIVGVFAEGVLLLKIKKIQEKITQKKEFLQNCSPEQREEVIAELQELKKEEMGISKNLKIRIF